MPTVERKPVEVEAISMTRRHDGEIVQLKRFIIVQGFNALHGIVKQRKEYLYVIEFHKYTTTIKINVYEVVGVSYENPMTVRGIWINRYNNKALGFWSYQPDIDYLYHVPQLVSQFIVEETNMKEGME